LTHIKGYLELLIEEELGSLTSDQKKALSVMRKSEERLEQLIEDLIHFSLVARGDLDLRMVGVDLRETLRQISLDVAKKCNNAGLGLKIKVPQKLPIVKADESKISWVVNQLLDNAVKFTPKNGWVTLEVTPVDQLLFIAISDTGIGINQSQLDEIFEPFHQLDSSATRRYSGTGLGLTLAKKIVEAHGSRIKVTSQVGVGSRFEFSLPFSS
jgi:signal transduction histidine kinase